MCGFVGIFGPGAGARHPHLPDAVAAIRHRGPDSSGIYEDPRGYFGAGHLRLSILDLSSAAEQPMVRPEGVLLYNGEIYNHQALRAELSASEFRSHSDTETLLEGLVRQGHRFLGRCEGMFAGCFFNPRDQSVLLFRDSLGIKPLYYAELPDSSVLFASEIKALWKLAPELKPRLNLETLPLYMSYENFPQRNSLFQSVQMLEPGQGLKLSRGGDGRVQLLALDLPYSSPERITAAPTRENILLELDESVKKHCLSDVPLGVYLSGGIDSSLVGALASRHATNIRAFTGYFDTPDAHYDERPLARLVAKKFGLSLQEVPITAEDFESSFDKIIYSLDEPRMGMGSFSQYVVAREAAKQRKVILAGHGGDELFAGYPLFKAFWLMDEGFASRDAFRLLTKTPKKEWPWLLNAWAQRLRRGEIQFAPELFPLKAAQRGNRQLGAFCQVPSTSSLRQLGDYYRSTYLPGLLVVEDKISMAHSLETRVPFWSQRLVEWATRIPIGDLLPGGRLKGLLKQVARETLPAELLTAPKRGFPTPLRLWFRSSLQNFVKDRLLDPSSRVRGLFSARQVERLLHSHAKRPLPFALDERRAHRIWILLCLESWSRQFAVEWEGVG